jgi:hypothetical protein
MYVGIHQPARTEYKYLMLSVLVLGILGGIALFLAKAWLGHTGVLLIVALLLANPAYEIARKWRFQKTRVVLYAERGRDLTFRTGEGDELYAWIRDETPVSSVFIDTTDWIPIFGQRALYVSTTDRRTCGLQMYDFFPVPDNGVRARRRWLADALLTGKGMRRDLERLFEVAEGSLYVVTRSARAASRLDRRYWALAFRSSDKRRSVFQLRGTGSTTAAGTERVD